MYISAITAPAQSAARGSVRLGSRISALIADTSSSPVNANAICDQKFTWANMMPHWSWDTVNFWSQIAFAFTGLELVSAMSAEIRDPRRTLPRAALAAGALIAAMYIVGTVCVLV